MGRVATRQQDEREHGPEPPDVWEALISPEGEAMFDARLRQAEVRLGRPLTPFERHDLALAVVDALDAAPDGKASG